MEDKFFWKKYDDNCLRFFRNHETLRDWRAYIQGSTVFVWGRDKEGHGDWLPVVTFDKYTRKEKKIEAVLNLLRLGLDNGPETSGTQMIARPVD